MKQYILYGNGGHSRVLKDLIHLLGGELVCIFDHENPYDSSIFPNAEVIIAIGNTSIREKISQEVQHDFGVLIHPSAVIAQDVEISEGSIVLANSVIQAGSKIGKHVIVNASVTIDHDVKVGDFVNIYPNSYIGGEAVIIHHKIVEPNTVVPRLSNV